MEYNLMLFRSREQEIRNLDYLYLLESDAQEAVKKQWVIDMDH